MVCQMKKSIFMLCIIVILVARMCNGGPIYWINKLNLQPLNMRYYPDIGFFTGSMIYGTIYQLVVNGTSSINSANPMNFSAKPFFSHPALNFSTGFDIDFDRNILFICHSNPNVLNEWSSPNGTSPSEWNKTYGFMSGVMIVNLTTSQVIADLDLQKYNVHKNMPLYHYANDIVLDSYGNAYITDTCGGAIYKLKNNNNNNNDSYTMDVFSYKESWLIDANHSNAPMFDGIDIDRKNGNFLLINALTTRLSSNGNSAMYKIPISHPMNVSQVHFTNVLDIQLGFDGQVFNDDGNYLYVVQESLNVVYQFITDNNWDSLTLRQSIKTKLKTPTTMAIATNGIFGTGLSDTIFVCGPQNATKSVDKYPIELLDFTVNSTKIVYKDTHSTDKFDTVHIILYILIGVCALLIIALITMVIFIRRYVKKQSNLNYQDLPGQRLDSPPDNEVNAIDQPILAVN